MRILLIVVYYPPIPNAAGYLMRDLAQEFSRNGHDVRVLTPSALIAQEIEIKDEDGIEVVRARLGEMKNVNRVIRLWRESRISETIWRRARVYLTSQPCDLIVYYSPTIFFGRIVKKLKAHWNCPAYLVLRDIFPQWAVEAGILRNGSLLYKYLRRREIEQYDTADVIGVEAAGNLEYFKRKIGGHMYNAEVLHNWTSRKREGPASGTWRLRFGLGGKCVFMYGGNLGVAQDLDNIIRLAANVRECKNIFILLVGEGSEVERLKREIDRLELSNITIHPPLSESEYLSCLSDCDVGLLSLDRRLRSHNIPGKLLSYVATGKPIVASLNPGNALSEILTNSRAGLCSLNGEDSKLSEHAIRLANDPNLRMEMGRNSHGLAEGMFSVESAATTILTHFIGLTIKKGNRELYPIAEIR
jgi:glycosyltransferase involved in cell wall biosynthesis